MNSLIKRLSSYFLIFVMLLNVTEVAYASNTPSPGDAFSNLLGTADISTTSPGYYQSQARGVFSAGGVSIRFPRKSVQLISITPPSIQSGCGGISVFFGGFSFISGAEMSQLVSNIAQVALGYVLQLAIKTMCPICGAVIEVMQKLAQMANKMGMDACAVGTKIGEEIGNSIFGKPAQDSSKQAQQSFCHNQSAADGTSDSFFDSLSHTCANFSQMIDKFDSWVNSNPDEKDAKTAEKAGLFGNSTWIALDNLGYEKDTATKELIMSMVGTVITPTSKDNKAGKTNYKPPIAGNNTEELMDMFMCGSTNGAGNTVAEQYCAKRTKPDLLKLYHCEDTVKCENPTEIGFQEWLTVNNWAFPGFMFEVADALTKAAVAVETADPQGIPAPSLQLMNSAPFPLFKVVNIAAVYPDVAYALINNNSEVIAGILAQKYFTDLVQAMGRRKDQVSLPPAMAQEVRKLLTEVRDRVEFQAAKTVNFMELQNNLMAQVTLVNQNIQNNLIPQGILGNQTFGANAGMYSKGK